MVEPPKPDTQPPTRPEPAGHAGLPDTLPGEGALSEGATVDIERVESLSARAAPSWLKDILPLPDAASALAPIPELEPLLRPSVASGILGAALRTWQSDGPVDSDLLVDRIARLEAFRTLTRRLQPTLREGAQILVDVSEGMAPFARDAHHLVEAIKRVAGDLVRVASFDTDPRRAGAGPRRRWGPWELVRGLPITAVSDVGIAPREPPADPTTAWLELAERARRAESSITAFVPWSADRWPKQLVQAMRLIQWDRRTTVSAALRTCQGHVSVR
jgi:hypothetical protein